MASTSTTDAAAAIQTIWDKEVAPTFKQFTILEKYANTKGFSKGVGDTWVKDRIVYPAKVSGTTAYGALKTFSDANALSVDKLTVSPVKLEDYFSFDDGVDLLSFITGGQWIEPVKIQMARGLDAYFLSNVIMLQGMRFRVDRNPTYQFGFTATSGSTTTAVNTTLLNAADNFYVGANVTGTARTGRNYGLTKKVTSSVQSTGTITMGAFPQAIASSSSMWLSLNTGISSSTLLDTTALFDASLLHKRLGTPAYGNEFKYVLFADSFVERDLMRDTVWQNSGQYAEPGRFGKYEVMRIGAHEVVVASELRREDTSGAATTAIGSSTVFLSPSIGKGAFSMIPWGQGEGAFGVKWYVVDQPDSGNLTASKRAVSWKAHAGAVVEDSTSCIILAHGATTNGLGVIV